jgi:hypothetical protein
MGKSSTGLAALQQRVEALERENAMLRRDLSLLPSAPSVTVPEPMRPLFDVAQETVREYFKDLRMDPYTGHHRDQRTAVCTGAGFRLFQRLPGNHTTPVCGQGRNRGFCHRAQFPVRLCACDRDARCTRFPYEDAPDRSHCQAVCRTLFILLIQAGPL